VKIVLSKYGRVLTNGEVHASGSALQKKILRRSPWHNRSAWLLVEIKREQEKEKAKGNEKGWDWGHSARRIAAAWSKNFPKSRDLTEEYVRKFRRRYRLHEK
jgi:hypothetical protein